MGKLLKALKVFFIILGVIFLLLAIFIGITIYQGKQIYNTINNDEFKADLDAVTKGDCRKLPELNIKIAELKQKISSACINPALRMVIVAQTKDFFQGNVCQEINSPSNNINNIITQIEANCTK